MGENFGNAADFVAVFTQQIMMNTDNHFAAGFQSGYSQQVQSTPHRSFGRIFYRRYQIIGLTRFNLFEAVVDGSTRMVCAAWPKCLMAACWVNVPFGPK